MSKIITLLISLYIASPNTYAGICSDMVYSGSVGGEIMAKCVQALTEDDIARKRKYKLRLRAQKYCDDRAGIFRPSTEKFYECNKRRTKCQTIKADCCANAIHQSKCKKK